MRSFPLNDQWLFWNEKTPERRIAVTLPHDAMRLEPRQKDNPGGVNISWYSGGDYGYERVLRMPDDLPGYTDGMRVILEFEGVYRRAEIYLNGEMLFRQPYGYAGFFVELTDKLQAGENTLRVVARNSEQPNSRWYSGSGIIRPVTLHLLPRAHILPGGVRITTTAVGNPEISVSVCTSLPGCVKLEILPRFEDKVLYRAEGTSRSMEHTISIPMPDAKLWSPELPVLYRCRVTFGEDSVTEVFGVRSLSINVNKGLSINGQRVILRGACVHHDNGLLGAVSLPFVEERKVRLLKQAGYNALRMAHNPCSKALLDACDKLGMLVIDEYADTWLIHKTPYDYAAELRDNWHYDLRSMVDKDFNHPSVILYSTGNEVAETSGTEGVKLAGEMTAFLHSLDSTRQVTCAVNPMLNYLQAQGAGIYGHEKAQAADQKHTLVGSAFFNELVNRLGTKVMKLGALLPGCDAATRDVYHELDVAGYNYGIMRYRSDARRYPDRVILGTETFCADAFRFMKLAESIPSVIGDFVWTGMDYLGEAGIGAWEYADYAANFNREFGWLTAGAGRVDVTGRMNGEALYTRVAFGLDEIRMAVRPVYAEKQRHSPSAWKLTDAIPSWSWNGREGCPATVEVYTRAPKAALYLNGKKLAEKKRPAHDCRILFTVPYRPGKLEARGLNEHGADQCSTVLVSAQDTVRLTLKPEQPSLSPNELAYVRICYTDQQGTVKPLCRGDVTVSVKGGELLALGNGCPYNETGYTLDHTDTWYGEALAIIRPTGAGTLQISATSKSGSAVAELRVK